jgi:hypothetical protein
LSVGTYTIKVEYRGSSYLTPSSAARQFIIRPAPFEISTVPPLPGARFSLDGRLLITDEGGIARTEVSQVKSYHLKYLPSEEQSEDVRFQFSRWGDEVFAPSREVNIPQKASLEAGFNLSYRVTLHFHDLEGERVPPSRVSSVTLKSSHSGSFVLEENSPQWFQANRVVRRRSGLEVTPLMYSIERVEVDGVNVVNRAQQRFFADPNDTWPIELLLHSAHFTAQDALFGFPIGSGIHLLHPDGRREDISFGPQDDVTIHSLARGLYSVRVAGALGYAPDTPVALSRDQDVSLLVLSYLDMAVAALLGATAVLGLLFLGRPHLLAKLRLRLSWMLQLPRLLWSGRE